MTTFTAETYQNEYLADGRDRGQRDRDRDGGRRRRRAAAGPVSAAEIVIVDTSGSMAVPPGKITAAKEATCAAIDCIRDGAEFAVIAGTDVARDVYPTGRARWPSRRGDARGGQGTRSRSSWPQGGTAIGAWLSLADGLFEDAPGAIRHAILLTDGQNQGRDGRAARRGARALRGALPVRLPRHRHGLGGRRAAADRLGAARDASTWSPSPSDLAADFTAMMERAMAKEPNDVALRLWTPQGAEVAFVKQVSPTIEDLTDRGRPVGALTAEYPTGRLGRRVARLPRLRARAGARRSATRWRRGASASWSTARRSARR